MMLSVIVVISQILQKAPHRLRTYVLFIATIAVVLQFGHRFVSRGELDMQTAVLVGAVAVVFFGGGRALLSRKRVGPTLLVVPVVVGLSLLICGVSARWHQGFAAHFDAYYLTTYFSEHATQQDRLLVLDERSYAFFGSRRQNYLLQPMLFDNVAETSRLMDEHELSTVVTRIENHKKLARYRPSWDALANDSTFEQTAKGQHLRIFVRK